MKGLSLKGRALWHRHRRPVPSLQALLTRAPAGRSQPPIKPTSREARVRDALRPLPDAPVWPHGDKQVMTHVTLTTPASRFVKSTDTAGQGPLDPVSGSEHSPRRFSLH